MIADAISTTTTAISTTTTTLLLLLFLLLVQSQKCARVPGFLFRRHYMKLGQTEDPCLMD